MTLSTQPSVKPARVIHAAHGDDITCKGWQQEAALRCLMNNLDPAVAERPEDLVVYGGAGKAARSWEAFDAIVRCLRGLEDDETLLIQSGKPVGIFTTTPQSPRVLIANSLIVPAWATWEEFWRLEGLGLTMYGQMTAGSWIYIGAQGIIQGTYETFAECARQHFGGTLTGRVVLTAGLGGMGGAQPLAITMNGGVGLIVEVDPERIQRRLESGFCDETAANLDDAIDKAEAARQAGQARSIALLGNAAEVLPALLERGFAPDVVTDQTSAHDPRNGYVPAGLSLNEALALRQSDPEEYVRRAFESMATHCRAMLQFQQNGSVVFDYGNNLRGHALKAGVTNALDYPGFVPAYIRPLFCQGKGPFRWVALSGDPADLAATDEALLATFPDDEQLHRWIDLAQKYIPFQGLPARICWLGYGQRAKFGLVLNKLVRDHTISAPIAIGRDHLDSGSVASPYRETEAMRDGSDAIADWPILNALLNTASGATWVSVHHGGGVGIGYAIHAGQVIVADGREEMDHRLQHVLTNDPGIGVARHADAGYEEAIAFAEERDVRIPMREHPDQENA